MAAKITSEIPVPTIGIGASAACDGQILVVYDLLGLTERAPKFAKKFADGGGLIGTAVQSYAEEVRARRFPGPEHVYRVKD